MVALPGGTFLMGSPENEEGRDFDEGPQHEVTIPPFAIGRYPVTVGEYRRFIEATGHRHEGGMYVWTGPDWKQDTSKSWRDPGFVQTDRHPVVGVSWHDAQAYAAWLAEATGKPYRLPSEAEWEYAARAGTTTRYAFGDEITEKEANFGGNVGTTTEVGAYPANPWGLYDMHGNVWEWVEDIWHDSYQDAPLMARRGRSENEKIPTPVASCVAAPGITIRGSCVRQSAAGTDPTTGSSIPDSSCADA